MNKPETSSPPMIVGLDRKVSHLCEHRLGGYVYAQRNQAGGKEEMCRKPATHVAKYPGKEPSYFCRKHAKTRNFITEMANARVSGAEPQAERPARRES